jgi:hypothetical protein
MIAAYRASEATIDRIGKWSRHRHPWQYLDDRAQPLLLRADYLCRSGVIHTVSVPPAGAPFGGTRPALGTNPIAFGFPTEHDPLAVDTLRRSNAARDHGTIKRLYPRAALDP